MAGGEWITCFDGDFKADLTGEPAVVVACLFALRSPGTSIARITREGVIDYSELVGRKPELRYHAIFEVQSLGQTEQVVLSSHSVPELSEPFLSLASH